MIMDNKPTTVIVQQAEESERQLVERAIASLSQSNWDVGECASRWTTKFAKGRGDEQFGNLIGLSRSQVQQCRQVYETYGDVRDLYPSLAFNHFYVARGWDDAEECLAWAEENQARVSEMIAWRRMNGGEDMDAVNDHFATSEPESSSCQNLAGSECPDSTDVDSGHRDDDEIQAAGQAEGFEDVADVDPYQRPPSTVVSTPRDFEDEPDDHLVADPAKQFRDVVRAFRAAIRMYQPHVSQSELAAELRRLADEIEGS